MTTQIKKYELLELEKLDEFYDNLSENYLNALTCIYRANCQGKYDWEKSQFKNLTKRCFDIVMIDKYNKLHKILLSEKIHIFIKRNDWKINYKLKNDIIIETTINELNYFKILIEENIFDEVLNMDNDDFKNIMDKFK